ncbi:hypothetical protein LTR86_000284 [Recurvomyces mirabilis]|nr:hypothetical protein LTR86_000284 [Recurvomyces mirabilis]
MRRLVLRIAIAAAFVLAFWLLTYTLEPRRTAYSCRFGDRHRYPQQPTQPSIWEAEDEVQNGNLRFTRQSQGAKPELLILVLARDANSWSRDFRSTRRSVYDFIDLLAATGLDFSTVSLAMATKEVGEYASMQAATSRIVTARTMIWLQNELDEVPYEQRHNPSIQLARRASLAKLRNRLMISALDDEHHILWLDADVVELSTEIIQNMLQQSVKNESVGIITAMCHQNQMQNYDKNAWRIDSPSLMGPINDDGRENAVSQLVNERLFLPEAMKGSSDDDVVPLDSVGGTILYIRANLVRQGLIFPYFNIVGTTWGKPGWIGVETEGLCYMARELKGGGCYALAGHHWARHTDWG